MLVIDGLDSVPVLTSDEVMQLDKLPKSLVVQGAGPIGLARIGTEVLLVNRSPLLSTYDPACGAELKRALDAEPNFTLLAPGKIHSLRQEGDELFRRRVRARGPQRPGQRAYTVFRPKGS